MIRASSSKSLPGPTKLKIWPRSKAQIISQASPESVCVSGDTSAFTSSSVVSNGPSRADNPILQQARQRLPLGGGRGVGALRMGLYSASGTSVTPHSEQDFCTNLPGWLLIATRECQRKGRILRGIPVTSADGRSRAIGSARISSSIRPASAINT